MSLWGKFFGSAGAVDPAPVAAPAYVHAEQVARIQEVSKAAQAEENSMSTAPVVSSLPVSPATPVVESFMHRLASFFRHGPKAAIALVQKDAKPVEDIALVAGTLAGVGPQVQAVEDTFNGIFSEVLQVQQIATAVSAAPGTGAQRLAAAVPQVERVILSDPLFKGKTITDLTKWNAAVASIAGAVYDLGSSVAAPTPASTPTSS